MNNRGLILLKFDRRQMGDATLTVTLTIVPDDYDPSEVLKATDEQGNEVASKRVEPNFVLTRASAIAWEEKGFNE